MARRRRQPDATVKYSAASRDDADIVAFARWTRRTFGSAKRGLSSVIRLTDTYTQWRRTAEWCGHCQTYVQITEATTDGRRRWVTLNDHQANPGDPYNCPGSGKSIPWLGHLDQAEQQQMMDAITRQIRLSQPLTVRDNL